MISWACGSCANGHGSTTVDFDKDGKGLPARKQTILDVAGNVDNPYQISFPINGNKDLDRVSKRIKLLRGLKPALAYKH